MCLQHRDISEVAFDIPQISADLTQDLKHKTEQSVQL